MIPDFFTIDMMIRQGFAAVHEGVPGVWVTEKCRDYTGHGGKQ